ncbi:ribonuclease J [Halomonas sp. 18H]|uniref:ribonuclease J n=1 Tax=Halomonas almeriensis TaxID=308163 RepID=UPI002231F8E2|nr:MULTISPECIES: ribonuclease J [Halomonas]MCW4151189.1 ribonuclease J [Halomonas sp. 18H]MDN3553069.1 ribonuclease J [Halomonas almeriensis]
MNFMLYGHRDQWIVVDCGMMIRQDLPDGPLQIPDTCPLDTLEVVPEAVVITHGHEDHIGAVAWLWPRWGCRLYATPLAAGLLRSKFAEQGLRSDAICVIEPGEALEIGHFALRYLPVTHSIPESCALLLEAGKHRVLHTGDWKLDPAPLLGQPIDPETFRAIAPVDLLVGDSTCAPEPGHSRSESEVAEALTQAIASLNGRVVVSCFASNLDRVLAIGRAAQRCGRRVSLMGRSMERMVRIARGLGYLEDFPALVPVHDLGYLPPEEVLVIATGSQGESKAALSRLAAGRHPHFELTRGDSVIFSARAIPGNERLIERLKHALRLAGVTLLDDTAEASLHASGHPYQDELRTFYSWVQPARLLPVHGETRHLQAHQMLAEELGIDAPVIPRNGDMLRLDAQGLALQARHRLTPRMIDQNRNAQVADTVNDGASRHGELFVAMTVAATECGWTRIGQLMLDDSHASPLDDTALAERLDESLSQAQGDSLVELRSMLYPDIQAWLADRMQRVPAVRLQLFAMETPSDIGQV